MVSNQQNLSAMFHQQQRHSEPQTAYRIDREIVLATDEETSHVMALTLNHSHNVFVVSKEPTPDLNQQVTQRVVLSIIFAVYDPVRLVATYTENSPPFVERHLAPKPATMGLQFA